MNKKEFDTFFQSYSKNVDRANNSAFWKLSDHLIFDIIKENIPKDLKKDAVIFDAGGGTGRWVCMLSDYYKSNFIIYDLSSDMLDVARKNIENKKIENRVTIMNGDLANIDRVKDNTVDFIISIYSPISFIYEQTKAAQEMFRILKPGGRMLIMSHGHLNAIASKINNYRVNPEELKNLSDTRMVRWAQHVPELVTHSKESIEKLLSDVGLQIIKTYGVPVFVQPGNEDFDPSNKKKSTISEYLENPDNFRAILDLEMKYNSLDTVANRGMNIFLLAEKK